MNPGRIRALTTRIVRQFRRDPRTLGLLFVVPVVVLSLIGYIYRGSDNTIPMGVTGNLESPLAQTAIGLLEDEERIEVETLSADAAASALEDGDVEGVLVLPEAGAQAEGDAMAPVLHLEGSDPGRAGTLVNTLQRVIPMVTLQTSGFEGEIPTAEAEFLHGGPEFDQLDFLAPVFIGFFAFFFVFLLTSVSFLRERMQGSIERLMVSPISRPEIVTGYMLGFSLFAAFQSAVIIGFSLLVLNVHQVGNIGFIFIVTLLLTLGSVNLGIFLSTFARTELQVVQFIPVVIVPQALLSGMIWPIETMPDPLQWLAHVMPLTWANEALRDVMVRGSDLAGISLELGILAGFAVLMVLLGSMTLRRDVA